MNKLILLGSMTFAMIACSPKEPPTGKLTKDHSIEVTYETKHLNDSMVLLVRRENIYLHGEKIKMFLRMDTIPSEGDKVKRDTIHKTIVVPKEYEFYVTVK